MSESDVETKVVETYPEKLPEGVNTEPKDVPGNLKIHTKEEGPENGSGDDVEENAEQYSKESSQQDRNCDPEKIPEVPERDADGSDETPGGLGETPDAHLDKGTAAPGDEERHDILEGDPPADDDDDEGLPIDRGWALFILAGSFLNVSLMIGYGRSIGILFVEYLHLFEASAATTTLFMGVMAAFFSLTSLISMNVLLQLLGERKLVLLGAVITTVGMLTAVFATSITFLICTHSILIGIGHSMIHGPALVLIGKYFKKRRGLATSIAMSGVSVGGSIFPPLVRFLVDEYGVRGSMLLMTGLNMNMLVGAALYRPLEFYKKRRRNRRARAGEQVPLIHEGGGAANSSDKGVNDKDVLVKSNDNHILVEESKVRKRFDSDKSDSKYSSPLQIYSSNPDMTSMLSLTQTCKTPTEPEGKQRKSVQDYLKMIVVLLDVRLFKDPMFQFFVVTSVFAILIVLVAAYLPALAAEKGVPPTEASLLLSIYGGIDFFSKLAAGYIVDLKLIKSHHIASVCLFITATATSFAFLYNTYAWMVMYAVILGLFGGVYNSLIPILIVDMMGVENMAKVLGFLSVFHGFGIAITHPVIGSIRDLTGSYNACMNYIGACVFVAAIGLLFEPIAKRRSDAYHRRKEVEQKLDEGC